MIRTEKLSKRFMIYDRPLDRLRDWLSPAARRRGREFWALREIDLEIPRGSSLGIVGVNGAGKSTLLKLITGTTIPTSGTYAVEGRVSALLELGMGFHPQFTGRENIFFNGKLLGLTTEELRERSPAIIEFAELGDFIDQPLRAYSSGMALRLAFAVASSVDPDTLIVDEALSVGDLHFQQKCLARIRRFQERGTTILFVSHDPALIKSFCTEAILLDGGSLVDRGKPDQVLDFYNALLAEKHRDDGARARVIRPMARNDSVESAEISANATSAVNTANAADSDVQEPVATGGHRAGNFEAVVTRVEIEATGAGGNRGLLVTGSPATILVRAAAREAIPAPTIGVLIKDRLGNEVFGVNTHNRGAELPPLAAGEAIEARFATRMNLGPGLYSITAAIHGGATHTEICYDWIERAATFQVLPSPADPFIGVCRLEIGIESRVEPARADELAARG